MNDSSEICTRCGQPEPTMKPGTITQWISVCQCALVDAQLENALKLCTKCGHVIDTGRRGSLTQWIFRSQVCECELPSPSPPGLKSASSPEASLKNSPDETEYLNLAGETFPTTRYKPISPLGSGGAGAVYLCWDEHLNKKVAVKVLLDADGEAAVKFQQEAKVTAKFAHPNVIGIIDFGMTESGVPFMVLDHFRGVGLNTILEQHGKAEVSTTLDIAIKVADALSYAHEENIFHRDIKPSNVLIAADNRGNCNVKVIDFGVAFMAAGQHSTNFQGKTLVGTPKYMPPDLALGNSYDVRSEIYSFGCLLYELLSGRPPFTGDDALELISKHATEMVPFFDEIGIFDIPESLQTLVMKCLEKNPDKRFRDMEQIKNELIRIQETLDIEKTTDSRGEVSSKEELSEQGDNSKDNRSTKIVLLAGGIALLFSVTFTALILVNSGEPEIVSEKKKKKPLVKRFSSLPEYHAHEHMFKFDQLKNLYLARAINTQLFEDKHLKELEGRDDVTGVNLFDTGIKGEGLQYLTGLPLKYLDLRQTPVDDAAMKYVKQMRQLKGLTLHKCTYITDVGIKEIIDLPIERLDLDQTRITDKGMQDVAKIKTLKVINLRDTAHISDSGISHLSGLPNLRLLYISSDRRSESYFEAVGKLNLPKYSIIGESEFPAKYLSYLNSADFVSLHGTIHGTSHIKELRGFKRLRTLGLIKCMLTNDEIDELSKLPIENLEIIDCPTLTAAKLRVLGRMKRLKNLYIADCARVKARELNEFIQLFPQITTSIKLTKVFAIETGEIINY